MSMFWVDMLRQDDINADYAVTFVSFSLIGMFPFSDD